MRKTLLDPVVRFEKLGNGESVEISKADGKIVRKGEDVNGNNQTVFFPAAQKRKGTSGWYATALIFVKFHYHARFSKFVGRLDLCPTQNGN